MTKAINLGFIGGGVNSAVASTRFIASQMDGRFKVQAGCFSRKGDVNSQTAEKIASHLRLKTGIFHIQYILRDGVPFIMEICRRAPGDLYIQFVHIATGADYPSFIVRGAAGLDYSD